MLWPEKALATSIASALLLPRSRSSALSRDLMMVLTLALRSRDVSIRPPFDRPEHRLAGLQVGADGPALQPELEGRPC